MSLRKCPTCGKDFRKGRLVFAMSAGKLRGTKVCQSCADGGVTVVAAERMARCTGCGKPAKKCDQCSEAKGAKLSAKKLVTHLRAIVKLHSASRVPGSYGHIDSRIEGLEAAIAAIESGKFNEGE